MVVRGDTGKFLSAIAAILMCPRALSTQNIQVLRVLIICVPILEINVSEFDFFILFYYYFLNLNLYLEVAFFLYLL